MNLNMDSRNVQCSIGFTLIFVIIINWMTEFGKTQVDDSTILSFLSFLVQLSLWIQSALFGLMIVVFAVVFSQSSRVRQGTIRHNPNATKLSLIPQIILCVLLLSGYNFGIVADIYVGFWAIALILVKLIVYRFRAQIGGLK